MTFIQELLIPLFICLQTQNADIWGGYALCIMRESGESCTSKYICPYHCYYVVRTYSTEGLCILLRTYALTYFFMISRTKYTKNVLVSSPAVLVREEIHCNKYPGTRRVMNVGNPGSKISTRFNPSTRVAKSILVSTLLCVFYQRGKN